jgi:membrane protease YdiL (CAAX protease family)
VSERFSHVDAVGWTLLLTLAWIPAAVIAHALAPSAENDLVMAGGIQTIVFLVVAALFAARRPGRSFSDLFAVRTPSLAFLVAAVLLGVALCAPAEKITLVIHELFPLPKEVLEEREAMLRPRSVVHGAFLVLVAALAGPFAEELFFRGALFTALRPHATAAATVGTTGLLFTLLHPEPRHWLPILALSLVLGYVRAESGSLWPALGVHAGFNATGVGMELGTRGETERALGLSLVVLGSLASLGLLAWMRVLGQGERARRARELDREVVS